MQNNSLKYFFILNLFFYFQIFSNDLVRNLPSPYCDLKEVLPFNGHGWYANDKWIEKLMIQNKIHTAIEVGSWLGCSTRHIASLLQSGGILYAVDTWLGSIEHHEIQEYSAMLPTLYEQFLSNVIHANLTDRIVPIRNNSLEAVCFFKNIPSKIDLIYIDAGHDTESVLSDMAVYWPFVADNEGILCGDDWWWESVKEAVYIFAQSHNLTVYAADNFWFLKNEGAYQVKDFRYISLDVWKFDKLQ